MPTESLKHRVTRQFEDVEITDRELGRLIETISWQREPTFAMPGRTGWHQFSDCPRLRTTGKSYRSAKLKGIGIWNPQDPEIASGVHGGEIFDRPHPPTSIEYEYTSKTEHIGISRQGQFVFVQGEPAPFGGMTYLRAETEYLNCATLISNGVPATVPLLLVEFPGKTFQGNALGCVVSLVPANLPFRLNLLMNERSQLTEQQREYTAQVYRSLGLPSEANSIEERLTVLGIVCEKYGDLLRAFSSVGLYRHSGGLDNLYYDCEDQQPLLTDLDSSRSLSELPSELRALQSLRDFSSAVYKLLYRICLEQYSKYYTILKLQEYDPVRQLVRGYFGEVDTKVVNSVCDAVLNYFASSFHLINTHRSRYGLEIVESRYFERDLFFTLVMTCAYKIYSDSDLFRKIPHSLTLQQIVERAEHFLKERHEYYRFLLREVLG